MSDQPKDMLGELREKRQDLKQRRSRVQRFYYLFLSMIGVLLIAVPAMVWIFYSEQPDSPFVWLALVYLLMPLPMIPSYRARLRDIENDLQEVDFQIDLNEFEVSTVEMRAEKLLRINDFQLRRYYDLNLSQNRWIFSLGILCIILGIAVIAGTVFLILSVAESLDTKIVIASLGALGSMFANFVAVVYLRMNTSTTKNLADFHSRLVETHQLLLGNLIASRIEEDQGRWNALGELAVRMAPKMN